MIFLGVPKKYFFMYLIVQKWAMFGTLGTLKNGAPDLNFFVGAIRVPESPQKSFKQNLRIYSSIFLA